MSKVAPWSSWAEFHTVYLQLTSSKPSERAQGVKRVETWRLGDGDIGDRVERLQKHVKTLRWCPGAEIEVNVDSVQKLHGKWLARDKYGHLRRTRCRLPVAVDITASFVEIMLNDAYLNAETETPRSDNELRLMYAMAVVRLVNGIVEAWPKNAKH